MQWVNISYSNVGNSKLSGKPTVMFLMKEQLNQSRTFRSHKVSHDKLYCANGAEDRNRLCVSNY